MPCSLLLLHNVCVPHRVPWEDLRKVLKDELEQVLESNQLTYTASRVTNPLTTALTAVPSMATASTTTTITEETSSSVVDATTANQEQVATGEEAVSTNATKTSDDDQPHVPEHDQEQRQQSQETQAQEAATVTADAADKKSEESVSQSGEGQAAPSETSSISKDDTSGRAETKDRESHEGSNGSAPVEKHGEDANKEKTPEQQEQGRLEGDVNVVPISINTLVLETPQGYHDRIKGLLDTFTSAPFTIQRVCELISSPTEHHTNLIKYLRAVEKVRFPVCPWNLLRRM